LGKWESAIEVFSASAEACSSVVETFWFIIEACSSIVEIFSANAGVISGTAEALRRKVP